MRISDVTGLTLGGSQATHAYMHIACAKKTKWVDVHNDAGGGGDQDHAALDIVMVLDRSATSQRVASGPSLDSLGRLLGPEHQRPL